LAEEEVELARTWGAPRALGAALRAAGLVEGGERGLKLLEDAVEVLRESPAKLEHAKARTELGAALRRANRRSDAREQLRQARERSATGPGRVNSDSRTKRVVVRRSRRRLLPSGGVIKTLRLGSGGAHDANTAAPKHHRLHGHRTRRIRPSENAKE